MGGGGGLVGREWLEVVQAAERPGGLKSSMRSSTLSAPASALPPCAAGCAAILRRYQAGQRPTLPGRPQPTRELQPRGGALHARARLLPDSHGAPLRNEGSLRGGCSGHGRGRWVCRWQSSSRFPETKKMCLGTTRSHCITIVHPRLLCHVETVFFVARRPGPNQLDSPAALCTAVHRKLKAIYHKWRRTNISSSNALRSRLLQVWRQWPPS